MKIVSLVFICGMLATPAFGKTDTLLKQLVSKRLVPLIYRIKKLSFVQTRYIKKLNTEELDAIQAKTKLPPHIIAVRSLQYHQLETIREIDHHELKAIEGLSISDLQAIRSMEYPQYTHINKAGLTVSQFNLVKDLLLLFRPD